MLYADDHGGAPLAPGVLEAVQAAAAWGGNPSSLHGLGRTARRWVDEAADQVRALVKAPTAEVVFTGSGLEASLLGLLGLARAQHPLRVVVGPGVHPSLTAGARQNGFYIQSLDSIDGDPTLQEIPDLAAASPAVVSLRWIHPQTGRIQPIDRMIQALFLPKLGVHVDGTEALGRIPVDFEAMESTALSSSAHTWGGPQGVGVVVFKKGTAVEPLWGGGGQQQGRRSGTPAVALIAGLGAAAAHAAQSWDLRWAEGLRVHQHLAARLRAVEGVFVLDTEGICVPQSLVIGIWGVPAAVLANALDGQGIMARPGMLASEDTSASWHAWKQVGATVEQARGAVRLSIPFTAGVTAGGLDQGVEPMVHKVAQVAQGVAQAQGVARKVAQRVRGPHLARVMDRQGSWQG